MSEETARQVREAEAAVSQRQAEAAIAKKHFLRTLAEELPSRLERIARADALAEPDVARALGKEGIDELRAQLRAAAEELARDLANASERIGWPTRASHRSRVSSSDIHSALFKYLYGPRIYPLEAILRRHGFRTRAESTEILPQDLYSQSQQKAAFDAIADALSAATDADAALRKAKAADDTAAVEDLWED